MSLILPHPAADKATFKRALDGKLITLHRTKADAGLTAGERYMEIARRWFTGGWTGNLAMADGICSEDVRTNGVRVGVAGPVGRIRDRLIGCPDLTTSRSGTCRRAGTPPDRRIEVSWLRRTSWICT